ncbi:MAG: endonuclease/exonuclease/phosphatase family protein [Streptosporangiaceae bacterium]
MPSPNALRVLHWNIHSWRAPGGDTNTAAAADLITRTAPDVVTLAEADEVWGSPSGVREVAARCGYSWVFVPAFEFGGDQPAGGFGNALLTTLPIRALQQWQLLWPPRLYDGTEPSEPRSATVALLSSPAGLVWAGVTHMPRADTQARDAALSRLQDLTGALDEPWLICGDFNTPPSSWAAPAVVSSAHLTYPADEPSEAIDYCVASPGFDLDAEVIPAAGSDHLPVLIRARPAR